MLLWFWIVFGILCSQGTDSLKGCLNYEERPSHNQNLKTTGINYLSQLIDNILDYYYTEDKNEFSLLCMNFMHILLKRNDWNLNLSFIRSSNTTSALPFGLFYSAYINLHILNIFCLFFDSYIIHYPFTLHYHKIYVHLIIVKIIMCRCITRLAIEIFLYFVFWNFKNVSMKYYKISVSPDNPIRNKILS